MREKKEKKNRNEIIHFEGLNLVRNIFQACMQCANFQIVKQIVVSVQAYSWHLDQFSSFKPSNQTIAEANSDSDSDSDSLTD